MWGRVCTKRWRRLWRRCKGAWEGRVRFGRRGWEGRDWRTEISAYFNDFPCFVRPAVARLFLLVSVRYRCRLFRRTLPPPQLSFHPHHHYYHLFLLLLLLLLIVVVISVFRRINLAAASKPYNVFKSYSML